MEETKIKTLQELTIAGYLFSIDNFAAKANASSVLGNPEKLQAILPEGLSAENVIRYIRNQVNPSCFEEECLCEGIKLAFGGDKWKSTHELKPLVSLLSTLQIENRKCPEKIYYQVRKLEPEAIFGKTEYKNVKINDVELLVSNFYNDFFCLGGVDFKDFIASLDSLLLQYLWCIPAQDDNDVDISLYQISKLAASFTSLLYRFHIYKGDTSSDGVRNVELEKFIFLNGDISGIQKYIFDLKSPKENAKLLRSKSFELLALSQVLAENMVFSVDGSIADIITTSGGKFMIALPNTEISQNTIKELRKEYEAFFLKEFAGKLGIVIGEGTKANGKQLCDKKLVQKLLNQIGYDGDSAKQRKMQIALNENGPILSELYDQLQRNGECSCCGTLPAQEEGGKCKNCERLVEIGRDLVHAGSLKILSDKVDHFGKMILFGSENKKDFSVINEYRPGRKVTYLPYVAPWKDEKERELKTFEEIATVSNNGINKLAMFKSDIDNLGLVFSSSLGENMCFARYAEMSRLFHYFFSVYYADFVNQNYKNKIYTVFSGGDDLCVIGNWKDIMHFASDFQKKIDGFSNTNPSITLSAGIVLASSSEPLRFIAGDAEEQLELSKHYKENGIIHKNAITVFDTTVSWKDYDLCLKNGMKLFDALNNEDEKKKLPAGLVYKMIDFANRARNVRQGNLRDLMWKSNFKYMVERNLNKKEESLKDFFKGLGTVENIEKSRIAVCYALYSNRK